ncbi:MAG: hypothetical protein A2122_01275 [Candidatus Liptonbacteria bacterium GWB1_49_6]|uniref:Uncharacterized protein n=1 Tax=Candidatus Liptonbacteria bacterium GWB1_49_6 TaxID=1798644 RepID=A0A1G2C536_9BACT|nr:MAG: hypothetical protein A2122_01275 [Candidatus Liptonbacteria bacterium GWB1_49_6]
MPDEMSVAGHAESEHHILEEDIQRLASEIRSGRERPESRNMSERELIKQSLGRLVPNIPASQPSDSPKASSTGPLPAYAKGASADTKLEIEHLLDIAFHKGIEHANAEAKKSTPFVVDAFHDALVGKIYPELEKRGLLK